MLSSELRAELRRLEKQHGDLETTCTVSLIPDGQDRDGKESSLPVAYESTVETLVIRDNEPFGKHVRIFQ